MLSASALLGTVHSVAALNCPITLLTSRAQYPTVGLHIDSTSVSSISNVGSTSIKY
jgi:hypothetical protein